MNPEVLYFSTSRRFRALASMTRFGSLLRPIRLKAAPSAGRMRRPGAGEGASQGGQTIRPGRAHRIHNHSSPSTGGCLPMWYPYHSPVRPRHRWPGTAKQTGHSARRGSCFRVRSRWYRLIGFPRLDTHGLPGFAPHILHHSSPASPWFLPASMQRVIHPETRPLKGDHFTGR